jgi:hypothetical protein
MKLGKVRRAMMHGSWYYRWRKPTKTPKIPNEKAYDAPSSTRAARTPTAKDDPCREVAEGLLVIIEATKGAKDTMAEMKAISMEITPQLKRKMTVMGRQTNVTFQEAINLFGGTQWSKVFAAAYGYFTAGVSLDDSASIDRAVATLQDALDSGP